jgi:adenylate cyclase class 2
MGTEIEKKYRLTEPDVERLLDALEISGAEQLGEEFEENILFLGGGLDPTRSVLRLRRVGEVALLTYKERRPSASAIKHQREDETKVDDPDAITSILEGLGFRPGLVYEKRRRTWKLLGAEVVVDQLPFGWYAEIEGDEVSITAAETALGLQDTAAEELTYPQLTRKHGRELGGLIESRFGS